MREVEDMFHAGLASELAKALAEERRDGSGRRLLSEGDRAGIRAREERERSARTFEHGLSVAGAAILLALVLLGPAGALALGIALVAVAAATIRRRGAARSDGIRPPTDPEDRWGVWRRVEPDPEYLRGRAA